MSEFVAFAHYPSFENSYREREVDYFVHSLPEGAEWIASEKVHGCNLSLTVGDAGAKWATRSSYLGDAALSKFNRADVVAEKYQLKIVRLFEHMKRSHARDLRYIRVYGELFGGKYEGVRNPYKAVQKETSYTPDIEFIAFDIMCIFADEQVLTVSGSEESEMKAETDELVPGLPHFLNPLDVIDLCTMFEVPVFEILARGTLPDLMALNPAFQTTIPERYFGLPALPGNEAEGYVLRPICVSFAPNGRRMMLKHKNLKFLENCNTKTLQDKVPICGEFSFSPAENELYELMKQYINSNRINAVISKLEEAKRCNRKGVFYLICKDAMDDISKDMADQLSALSGGDGGGKLEKHQLTVFTKRLLLYTEQYCNANGCDFT